jgi:hypothetical protein
MRLFEGTHSHGIDGFFLVYLFAFFSCQKGFCFLLLDGNGFDHDQDGQRVRRATE